MYIYMYNYNAVLIDQLYNCCFSFQYSPFKARKRTGEGTWCIYTKGEVVASKGRKWYNKEVRYLLQEKRWKQRTQYVYMHIEFSGLEYYWFNAIHKLHYSNWSIYIKRSREKK